MHRPSDRIGARTLHGGLFDDEAHLETSFATRRVEPSRLMALVAATFGFIGSALAAAGELPAGWRIFNNTNVRSQAHPVAARARRAASADLAAAQAVYSRLAAGPGKSVGDITHLGTLPSWEACTAAATKTAGAYNSVAWHGALPGPYHQQCYGVAGNEWSATRQQGVTSAKGPHTTPAPPPAPSGPSPPPPGPCTGKAGCNYNGECVSGACKCTPQFVSPPLRSRPSPSLCQVALRLPPLVTDGGPWVAPERGGLREVQLRSTGPGQGQRAAVGRLGWPAGQLVGRVGPPS